jgi:D-glycero-D-manno-heptose 1,7-bisphosphate phosphatase
MTAGVPSPRPGAPRAAVFLDKDGTLVEDVPFNVDPGRIRFTRGAEEALRALHRAGYALVIVSNQPGVALGVFGRRALDAVEARLRDLLGDTPLTAVFWCPHSGREAEPCACRKPSPGMLLAAARLHDLDLASSWMIGDILDDVEAGRSAGCRTILVDHGGETEWRLTWARRPDYRCRTLAAAADVVLASRGRPSSDGTVVADESVGEPR